MSYPQPHFPTLRSEHLDCAGLFADRNSLLSSMPFLRGGVVAELGVALGEFSRFIIETLNPTVFVAFDTFNMHEWPEHWGIASEVLFQGHDHLGFFRSQLSDHADVVVVERGMSHERLPTYPNCYFDLIYVDAGHVYADVKRDAEIAVEKIKRNGVLIFNDYIMFDHLTGAPYGVVQVVNDLVVNQGWRVIGFALQQHMFCDIALRRSAT